MRFYSQRIKAQKIDDKNIFECIMHCTNSYNSHAEIIKLFHIIIGFHDTFPGLASKWSGFVQLDFGLGLTAILS